MPLHSSISFDMCRSVFSVAAAAAALSLSAIGLASMVHGDSISTRDVEPSLTQNYRPLYLRIVGAQNHDFEACETVWDFFKDERAD